MNIRDDKLDIVKGICILLMVWGHLPRLGALSDILEVVVRWIYTFHMPIFAFISGWLFGCKSGIMGEVIKVINRMFKPYFSGAIILSFCYFVASRIGLSTSCNISDSCLGVVKDILMGYGGGALWYLYTIGTFQIFILLTLMIIKKMRRENGSDVFVFLWVSFVLMILCKFNLNIRMSILSYFWLGYYMRRFNVNVLEMEHSFFAFSVLVLGLLLFCKDLIGSMLLIWPMSIFGVILIFSRKISGTMVGKLLGRVGKNTLEILIFHNMIAVGLRPFSKYILKYEPSGVGLNILFLVLIILLCVCIGAIIRKVRCLRLLFYS